MKFIRIFKQDINGISLKGFLKVSGILEIENQLTYDKNEKPYGLIRDTLGREHVILIEDREKLLNKNIFNK